MSECVSQTASADVGTGSQQPADFRYKVGTLTYTKFGLAAVFFWLLWGDFCLTIMESLAGRIMPVKLDELGATNTFITIVAGTIPAIMNAIMTPILSFRSDRKRGRWGRRIPYLLVPTPFVVAFLLLVGFSEQIGPWLHQFGLLSHLTPQHVTLWTLAVMYIGFTFFNLFITSIYYYLFNDVVPEAFLGRFIAAFRMVGQAGSIVFSWWVLPIMTTHVRHVFSVAAVLYGIAFIGMCLRVREGQYPPPPPNTDGRQGAWSSFKTFWKECFLDRRYQLLFLSSMSCALAWQMMGHENRWHLALGLSWSQISYITTGAQIVSFILMYPAGVVVDRLHPVRVQIIALPCMAVGALVNSSFLLWDFGPSQTFWVVVLGTGMITVFNTLFSAADMPLYMRCFPKDRFGQFCAARAMLCAFVNIISGLAIGSFFDLMESVHGRGSFYLRYQPLWIAAVWILASIFCTAFFLQWRRNGWLKPSPAEEKTTAQAKAGGIHD